MTAQQVLETGDLGVQMVILYNDGSLYSKDIESFLKAKKVEYVITNTLPAIKNKYLCVDGKDLSYYESIEWLNNYNVRRNTV